MVTEKRNREFWANVGYKWQTAIYLLVALACTIPAWIVQYPPIEDLPYHLATLRVIHSINDPQYGLDDFVLTLGRTQYFGYYFLGSGLAYLVGVARAHIILVSLYLGGTVLSLRYLLRVFGKDERLALFCIPLLVNSLFMLGLFPLLLGVPIMFVGLGLAISYFGNRRPAYGIWLGVTAFALFFVHILPFAIFGVGFAVLFPWRRPRQWLLAAAPVVPALVALVWWVTCTEAGQVTAGMMSAPPQRVSFERAVPQMYQWATDNFRDNSDEKYFGAYLALIVLSFVLSLSLRDKRSTKPVVYLYALVPLACLLLYFTSGDGYRFIWPLGQRFVILFALTAVPLIMMPKGKGGYAITALIAILSAGSIANTCLHFIAFEQNEVGPFQQALAQMAPKKKVAALIYDSGSRIANWTPFLHFGSYYQAEKGGVVQFTFAGYPHWPFDFRPGRYPPPGGAARPRWEWTPQRVPVWGELHPYYDYVLTRGEGFRAEGAYHQTWKGGPWGVWERSVDAKVFER